jgi:hypothetical protein
VRPDRTAPLTHTTAPHPGRWLLTRQDVLLRPAALLPRLIGLRLDADLRRHTHVQEGDDVPPGHRSGAQRLIGIDDHAVAVTHHAGGLHLGVPTPAPGITSIE